MYSRETDLFIYKYVLYYDKIKVYQYIKILSLNKKTVGVGVKRVKENKVHPSGPCVLIKMVVALPFLI